ncbi:MAG: NeuD/PglB/VioB family sugar acetyltransferase [Rhizobiales bacterium]|nr:NeuD/PglB/VioB family sugar acetyltransferase [Hyphomicrobiales bacterium]
MHFNLWIAGAGGFGREVAAYAQDAIDAGRLTAVLAGFLDDTDADPQGYGCPLTVKGTIDGFRPQANDRVIVAVGAPAHRAAIVQRLEAVAAQFVTLVHPLAYVSAQATLGPGVIVAPFATVGPHAVVGAHAIVNIHAGIGHDCRVGAASVISPHAVLNGWVVVEAAALVGSSAVVTEKVTLGAECKIAAGSVVYSPVPAGALAIGNPARLSRLE